MTMHTARRQILGTVVVISVMLAAAGTYARRHPAGRCDLDGARIDPAYQVRILDDEGQRRIFCCIRCAELWLEARRRRPQAVFVTDERSGHETAAAAAFFVRSAIVTTPTTGNRMHAFQDRADAETHAATAGGRVLTGDERPFFRETP